MRETTKPDDLTEKPTSPVTALLSASWHPTGVGQIPSTSAQWWHRKDSSGAVIACPSAERIVLAGELRAFVLKAKKKKIWCPAWRLDEGATKRKVEVRGRRERGEVAAHLPAARFVHWQQCETDGKVVVKVAADRGGGTIHSEAGTGSNSTCSTIPFISTPHEDPANAMGVVKMKDTLFCWAGSPLMFSIMTANERNFAGCLHHGNGSSTQ
ncbi:hypothetical protein Q8A73_023187 [Channa argus]|nr:hypothetical protein Q8A73_023187 [Channa argus]